MGLERPWVSSSGGILPSSSSSSMVEWVPIPRPPAERGIPRAPLRLEPGAMAPNEVKAEKVDIQYPPSAPAARSTPVSGLSADASTTRDASFFGAALVVYRGNFFASARCC
jgi:hypothetical protein